ncbi:MAG: M20/M25/M40 family metallo-hydrolase, partial [Marmoricola sp.]
SEASATRLREGITDTLQGVARAHGVDVEIGYLDEYPLTINTAAEVDFGAGVVRDVLGEERYEEMPDPISGSEDFSRVLDAVPGAFIAIGAVPPGLDTENAPMNHSPRADFDPEVLPDVAAVYAALAVRKLESLAAGG